MTTLLIGLAIVAAIVLYLLYARWALARHQVKHTHRQVEQLVRRGGVIVAQDLSAHEMAQWIEELETYGYAVMPTGPASIYARPPEPYFPPTSPDALRR